MLRTSCYPRKSLNNIPRGIALRLRRCICDTYEKFNCRSIEYKNYLIAKDYKPSIVSKNLSRQQAGQNFTKWKSQMSKNFKLIMKYNPRRPDLNCLLKKHMPLLHRSHIQNYYSAGLYQCRI